MADRADLRTYAREQTLLDSDDVADSILNTYLDRAVQIVATRFKWPFLETSTTFDSVADQHVYDMPDDWTYTESITEDGKNVRLRELSSQVVRQRYGDDPPTGDARSFYVYGEKLYLVEKPTQALTYNHFYRKSPTLFANDDATPEWDSNHHLFLAEYVIQQLWLREEDRQQAGDAQQRFEEGLGDLAQFYLDRASDDPMVWGEWPDRIVGGNQGNMPWLNGV